MASLLHSCSILPNPGYTRLACLGTGGPGGEIRVDKRTSDACAHRTTAYSEVETLVRRDHDRTDAGTRLRGICTRCLIISCMSYGIAHRFTSPRPPKRRSFLVSRAHADLTRAYRRIFYECRSHILTTCPSVSTPGGPIDTTDHHRDSSTAFLPRSADFDHRKIRFSRAAHGANPAVGNIRPAGTGFNSVLRTALRLVVKVSAEGALPLLEWFAQK